MTDVHKCLTLERSWLSIVSGLVSKLRKNIDNKGQVKDISNEILHGMYQLRPQPSLRPQLSRTKLAMVLKGLYANFSNLLRPKGHKIRPREQKDLQTCLKEINSVSLIPDGAIRIS